MDSSIIVKYLIAAVVLYGIWVTPSFIIWCISLCTARRRSDPARVGLAWFKAVYPFWILSLVFLTVSYALRLWLNLVTEDRYIDINYSVILAVDHAGVALWATGWLFKYLADILLLVTLAELGSGFLLCLTGATRFRKPIRFVALGVAALLFILDIAWFGIVTKFYNSYYARPADSFSDFDFDIETDILTMDRLAGSIDILLWIACLPVVGFASYVVHQARGVVHLRNSAGLFLAAAILNFVRMTTQMAISATYTLATIHRVSPIYVDLVVRPLLDALPMFVLLILLFIIGNRKQRGLWSTAQPQWGVAGITAAASYAPGGAAPQQPPIIWQGQPYYQYPQQQPMAGYPQQPPPAGYAYPGYPQSGNPPQQPAQAYTPQQQGAPPQQQPGQPQP